MEEFEKLMKMCSDLMDMNRELTAIVQSQGNDKKFEQATTPDGLPIWESKAIDYNRRSDWEKYEKEGWEPIGSIGCALIYKRPVKKQEPKQYGYER